MTVLETQRLAELIGRKHDCLMQLRDLGREQDGLIDDGEMTGLLQLLAVKQRLLESLQQVERQLDPYRDQDPEARQWTSQAERDRCAHMLVRCEALLKEIVNQEKQSEAQLRVRRDETAARLQNISLAHEARGAYINALGDPGPGQLDLSCEG